MMRILVPAVVALVLQNSVLRARAQYAEEQVVQASTVVLSEAMGTPLSQIPQTMLADAYGVAIIPNVIKGGFVVGARHGRGLLFIREADGMWHAPVFITLTGGNIGWQVGVQSSDIILVFKTFKSVQNILAGKLTIGADAAAAAGPVGRQGAVATDGRLQAEIYSYSRSRGLFVGLSIDGSVLRVNQLGTGSYYRPAGPGQPVVVPASAQQLTRSIASFAGGATTRVAQDPRMAQQYGVTETEALRRQLIDIAPRLYEILDEQWKAHLALPSELYLGGNPPPPDVLRLTLSRFAAVVTDVRFQQLAQRPEFQSVYALLRHYQESLSGGSSTIQLPPPPAGNATSAAPRGPQR